MRTISEQKVGRADKALGSSSRIKGLTRVLGGIVFLTLLHIPVHAGQSVTLAWSPSADSSVVGYNMHYGTASGNYSNSVKVGNVTTNTVAGLASGVTYFFAVTAYNASGLESIFSNEISFMPGLPTVRIRVTANGQVVLTVIGQVGSTCDIQASADFTTWMVIGTVTVPAGGSLDFTDTNAASHPNRLYRTYDTHP